MSTCQVDYPSELPLDCVKEAVRIIRQRRIVAEKSAFAHHVWVIQGYLQSKLLGDAQNVIGGAAYREPVGADDLMCGLLEVVARHDSDAIGDIPLPVALILRWLLVKLLEMLSAEAAGSHQSADAALRQSAGSRR